MKCKVLIAALALAVMTGLTVRAEDEQPTTPPKRADGHRQNAGGFHHEGLLPPRVLEKLNLTADQKTQYEAIESDYKKAAAPIREKIKAAREAGEKDNKMKELLQELMPIRKAATEKLGQILTDDQKAEFKKLREEHRNGQPNAKNAPKPKE